MKMTTVTLEDSDAPCFSHESFLAPPAVEKQPSGIKSPHRHRSPARRWNGDGKGIQVDIGTRLREYVDCLNNSKWNVIGNHLADELTRNGHSQTREEHITRLQGRTKGLAGFNIKIDTMLVDKKARAVAARYVNRMTLVDERVNADPVEKTIEFDEQCFVWFNEKGKISRIVTIQDNDGIRAQNPTAEMTPKFLTRSMPDKPVDLGSLYRAYVISMNQRTMKTEFPKFCRKDLRHNNRPFTVQDYARNLDMSHEVVSGLHFEIKELLVDEETQQVAARLELTGTPTSMFAGIPPNGKSIKFNEHCMYRFDKGKISVVWATMELDVVRKQLEARADRRKSSMLGIN
ncbi:SnoaL-like polyketide cyclase [Colletotrichum chrysophilum]|uniref:SnoaL-like polyketide cyclase n=2 Tax=Colletotrichum chrysophilum TaxID=1836956 RepID=A0AAD9AKT9_9PEZI|nr:SnoaL-like polyketide cyclase [Colletotrichum chrysophilum]